MNFLNKTHIKYLKKQYGNYSNSKKAFSMIEIMVVLVVMALAIGITIPALSNVSRFKAKAEIGKFNAFLSKMFMKSIRKNLYIRIVVDFDSNSYYAEKSDEPFSLISGDEVSEYNENIKNLKEKLNSEDDDLFKDKKTSLLDKKNLFSLLNAKNEDENLDDIYNWENFIPPKQDIKKLFIPAFEKIGKKLKLPNDVKWISFYSYHLPKIITNDLLQESNQEETEENKEKTNYQMYIYIFPQGRIEPFFLSIGNIQGDAIAYIQSDFFDKTKILPGNFEDEVEKIKKMFQYKDEEGK